MELQVGKKLLAKAPPVHPNSDPPPIKATIKGYGVAAYRRASTNQEAAATSSAKISICKTVKLSGQPGQGSSGTSTHTHTSFLFSSNASYQASFARSKNGNYRKKSHESGHIIQLFT